MSNSIKPFAGLVYCGNCNAPMFTSKAVAQYLCGEIAQYDKNSEAALHWFKKSAAQGNERAIKALQKLGEKLK